MCLTFWLFSVAPSFDSLGQAVQLGCIWGLISGFLLANARARLVLGADGLRIHNLLTTTDLPWGRIVGVEDRNGLHLVGAEGERFGVLAFGSSLIAGLTGNRRSRAIASEIRQGVAAHSGSTTDVPRRSFNFELPATMLVGLAVYLASAIAAYQLLHH